MIPKRLTRHAPALCLAALISAHLCANFIWIRADRTMRSKDMGCHMANQSLANSIIAEGVVRGALSVARGDMSVAWPSAAYLPLAVPSLLLGQSVVSLRLYNIFWFGLLILSVFAIGRRVGSTGAGLTAAALVSLYPAIYGASRQFGADFPGAAVAALCVAQLLASDRFRRLGPSVTLGLCLGAGILVRPHTALHLLGPVAFVLIAALRRPEGGRLLVVRNAALAAGICAALTAVWWMGRTDQVIEIFVGHQTGSVSGPDMQRSSFMFYLGAFLQSVSPLMLGAAAVATLGLLTGGARGHLRPRAAADGLIVLVVWLVAGFVLQSLIQHMAIGYLFSLLPALALITGVGLSVIRHRKIRRTIVAVTLGGGAAACLLCSFDAFHTMDPHGAGYPQQTITLQSQYCSPFGQCGSWEYSGPPAHDEFYLAADKITSWLKGRHGAGRGLLVRIDCCENIHASIVAKATLMTELPGALFTGLPHRDFTPGNRMTDPLFIGIAGTSILSRTGTYRQCYYLQIVTRVDSPVPTGARKILDLGATSFTGQVRFVLWNQDCTDPG